MEKILFIDRDGTLIKEPSDQQVDTLEKLEFVPGVFRNLYQITQNTSYKLVLVSNQDGLGTPAFPEFAFQLIQDKMLSAFRNEGIEFDDVIIDRTFPEEQSPTRKPGTALLQKYINGNYDLAHSFVIGDRGTDLQLAQNLGAQGILLADHTKPQTLLCQEEENSMTMGSNWEAPLITAKEDVWGAKFKKAYSWDEVYTFVAAPERTVLVERKTKETTLKLRLDLDGHGSGNIHTGLGFFDHMLDQIAHHSGMDLTLEVKGDLEVDEHHTIEDTALALGEAVKKGLGDKRGIGRYGFCLPMDDSLAQVALDFGGRPWLVWEADFRREKIGDMPTEMFLHFFKSFSDAAECNLNIKAEGQNEHHKIEGIFKALARSLKMAIKKERYNQELPTSKGVL